MTAATTGTSPALAASLASWSRVQAHDREGWLALMSPDVVIEDPIGTAPTNPTGTGYRGTEGAREFWNTIIGPVALTVTCEETFPSSSPHEIAHILVLQAAFDSGITTRVRGVFTYTVDDAGLITALRGYWTLDALTVTEAPAPDQEA